MRYIDNSRRWRDMWAQIIRDRREQNKINWNEHTERMEENSYPKLMKFVNRR